MRGQAKCDAELKLMCMAKDVCDGGKLRRHEGRRAFSGASALQHIRHHLLLPSVSIGCAEPVCPCAALPASWAGASPPSVASWLGWAGPVEPQGA